MNNRIEVTSSLEEAFQKLNFTKEADLRDLVSLFTFEDDGQYFHTKDGRFAKIWEIGGIDVSCQTEDFLYAISDELKEVLSLFPENSTGQILRHSYADISPQLSRYVESIHPDSDEFTLELADSLIQRQLDAVNDKNGFFKDITPVNINAAKDAIEERSGKWGTELKDATHRALSQNKRSGGIPINVGIYLVLMWDSGIKENGLLRKSWKTIKAALGDYNHTDYVLNEYNEHLSRFLSNIRQIEKKLSTMGAFVETLTGQGVVDLIYRLYNPSRSKKIESPKFSSDRLPIELFLNPEATHKKSLDNEALFSTIIRTPRGWNLEWSGESYFYRSVSLDARPNDSWPGMLQQKLADFTCESLIAINFSVVARSSTKRVLYFREKTLNAKEGFPLVNKDILETEKAQLKQVKMLVSEENLIGREQFIDASIHIVLMGKDSKKIESDADELESILWDKGRVEAIRGDAIIQQSMPFNFQKEHFQFLQRDMQFLTSFGADLAPMFVSFQGVQSPAILMNNVEGTPIFIDLYSPDVTTGHSLVVGTTGSGKSFVFNNILIGLIAKYKPKIWIIDKGGSYQSLCEAFDGNYIELSASDFYDSTNQLVSPKCTNPFYTTLAGGIRKSPNNDEIEFLSQLLVSMINASNNGNENQVDLPLGTLDLFQTTLRDFYNDFYKLNPTKEATFSDYIGVLKNRTHAKIDGSYMADLLSRYYGNGALANIFDGKLDFNWESDFSVLETARLATSTALPVILLSMFRQIDEYSKHQLPVNRKKIIAVDEAWNTLNNSASASALAGFYRELRKYSGACILISQAVKDFISLVEKDGSSAGGILENTSHFFLLTCSSDDYKLAAQKLSFSPEEVREWANISSLPPFYSEIFYRKRLTTGRYKSGVFRLYAPAMNLWISSTDPADKAEREKLVAKFVGEGMSISKARQKSIKENAKKFPYGARYELQNAA